MQLIPTWLGESILRGTYSSLGWLLRVDYEQIALENAFRFLSQSKRGKLLTFSKAILGLPDGCWETPRKTASTLQSRFRARPSLGPFWIMLICRALFDEGRRREALELACSYCGLRFGEQGRIENVAEAFSTSLAGVEADARVILANNVAWLFSMSDFSENSLRVLEGAAGLETSSWSEPSALRTALARGLDGVSRPTRRVYFAGLLMCLTSQSRMSDGEMLLEALAGGPDDLQSLIAGDDLAAPVPDGEVPELVDAADPQSRTLLDSILGQGAAAAQAAERSLGFSRGTYTDRQALRRLVRFHAGSLLRGDRIDNLLWLGCCLTDADRCEDALRLLSAIYDLEEWQLDDPEKLSAAVQRRARKASPVQREIHHSWVLQILQGCRPDAARRFLLQWVGWTGQGDEIEVSVNLGRIHLLAGGHVASPLLETLCRQLAEEGRHEVEAVILDIYLRRTLEFTAYLPKSGFVDHSLLSLSSRWLELLGENPEKGPLAFCRATLERLRVFLPAQGVGLEDRVEVFESLEDLRRRILQAGLHWSIERRMRREAPLDLLEWLCWDMELSQRLLSERLLLVQPGAAPRPTSDVWLESRLPADLAIPSQEQYLPSPPECWASLGCLEKLAHENSALNVPNTHLGTAQTHSFASELIQVYAQQGVDPIAIGALLGDRGLLLRASFDAEGSIVWMAVRGEAGTASIVARGRTSPRSLARVRWAVARHDAGLDLVRWRAAAGFGGNSLPGECAQLMGELRVGALGSSTEFAFSELVGSQLMRLRSLQTASAPWLAKWLDEVGTQLVLGRETGFASLGGAGLTAELDRTHESFRDSMARNPKEALEVLSGRLLEEIAAVFDLESLAAVLSKDCEVICCLDDALHGVPAAFLPVNGKRLWERVASVRVSLSPLLDLGLGAIEGDNSDAPAASADVLCISGVVQGDRAWAGVPWLHHGHWISAEKNGLKCLHGFQPPGGSVAGIRAALSGGRRFAAATICGHGSYEEAGIVLPANGHAQRDELWNGAGCDLSGIAWLILVSCSIGRAKNTDQLDVEGFCVQLFAHRARSILAARWPVSAVEAAAFANEVLDQYLRLMMERRQSNGPPGVAGLRAQALAAARQRFSLPEKGSDRPLVGLNTAAAFELYGLG